MDSRNTSLRTAITAYLNPHLQYISANKKPIRQIAREGETLEGTKAKAQTKVVEGREGTQLSLFNLIHILAFHIPEEQ
jgi:hypothetical protein